MYLYDGTTLCVALKDPSHDSLVEFYSNKKSVSDKDFYLTLHGRPLGKSSIVPSDCVIHVNFRLFGGKGGFGAALRGKGAKASKKKNTDFTSCRDLEGRRVGEVQNEAKIPEIESKIEEAKQKERIIKEEKKSELKQQQEDEKQGIIKKQDELLKNQSKIISDAVQKCLKKQATKRGNKRTPF